MAAWKSLLGASAVGLGLMVQVSPAHARPELLPEVERTLMMPCTPDCTICHKTNLGGLGTLVPLGLRLRDSYGLLYYDPSTVAPALAAAETPGPDGMVSDVDGDGVGDVEELRSCMNPNNPDMTAGVGGGEDVEYGCVGRIAPASSSRAGTLSVLVGLGALVWAARRRQR